MGTVSVNLSILLGLVPVGVFFAWFILRQIDKLNGVSFGKDIMPEIRTDAKALAFYYGVRFFAVLYFVSALLNRFV
jgi:hypothetical protein